MKKILSMLAVMAMVSVGLVVGAISASAHTPSITANCTAITASGVSYESGDHNALAVTLDGVKQHKDFETDGTLSVAVPQDGKTHTWSAKVWTSNTNPTYRAEESGTVGPCGETTPETEKIQFCHWAEGGHYNFNDTSKNAFYEGHREHAKDIYPAGSIKKKGQTFSWPAQGDQSLLTSNCEVPEVVDVETTPVAPEWVDECGLDNAHWVFTDTDEYTYKTRTNRNGESVINVTPNDGYVFPEGTQTKWVNKDSGTLCPPTNQVCEIAADGGTSTNLHPTWTEGDLRSAGHYEYVTGGLHIWTDDASSNAKVALDHAASFDLKDTGTIAIDYDATTGIEPGVNLRVNFDGTNTGTLVYESVYGQDLWLTNGSSDAVKANAPVNGGGNGSQWHGTIDQWLAKYPTAKVTSIAFSLGSGVHADGVLNSITVGCTQYKFDHETPPTQTETTPPVTPTTPSVTETTPPVTETVTPTPSETVTPPVTETTTAPVVTTTASPTVTTPAQQLAYTGFNAWIYAGIGFALILAGGVLLAGRKYTLDRKH